MNSPAPTSTQFDLNVLTELKLEILQAKRNELTKSLNPERHFDFLRSRHLLSEEDAQEIQNQTTRKQKAGHLLDLLLRNPNGFENLCESLLEEKTQIFLLKMLNEEYEKRVNTYRSIMQPNCEITLNMDTDSYRVPLQVDSRSLPKPSSVKSSSHNTGDTDSLKETYL